MSMRTRILLFLFIFALVPLLMAVAINLPLVLERVDLFYRQAFLQNLRADFADLDQHLATRNANLRLLARLPEPSLLTDEEAPSQPRVDLERARYTEWINRILRDERDIIEIRFLDRSGEDRFWLVRDSDTGAWLAPPQTLPPLRPQLREAVQQKRFTDVTFSAIRVDPDAAESRRALTLHMVAPITLADAAGGAVVITIDISGLAKRDRNTLWVLDTGEYLQLPGMPQRENTAFVDYPGLEEDFAARRIVLWERDRQRVIWVPMFVTESGAPLWVGRTVSSEPLKEFRSEMVKRVLAIVFGLIVLLLFAARMMAKRAEQISSELLGGIQKTLESDRPVTFEWKDTRELRQLSADLTRLSQRHAAQTRNLRAHTRELEESNRYKSEFLANVSHELRTPLNSILLLSKLLSAEEAGLQGEQAEQARVIHKAGNDLKQLIDNILDLSKIEARQFEVHCEDFELALLLEDVRELLQPQFDQKRLPLTVNVEPGTPPVIRSDPDKIRQVLKNFVSNALKFTDSGEVRLVARPAAAPYAVEIAVEDTGIGIAAEKQRRVFEAFQQADGSTSRRYGGTGLGLTISRQLAQLMQGDIHLVSEAGVGSTFALLLPLSCNDQVPAPQPQLAEAASEPAEAQEAEAVAIDLHGAHVLLMEADVKTQLQLSQQLNAWHARVSLADDLEEACESIDDAGPAAMLLLDPGLLGDDACATIQGIKTHNKAPMTLVAIAARPAAEPDCAGLQPDHVLGKPVDPDAVRGLFQDWTPPRDK